VSQNWSLNPFEVLKQRKLRRSNYLSRNRRDF